MRPATYAEIIERSAPVDAKWRCISETHLDGTELEFTIPESHARYNVIRSYKLVAQPFSDFNINNDDIVFLDPSVSSLVSINIIPSHLFLLKASESEVKTLAYMDQFVRSLPTDCKRIVAIGGGVILNCATYAAEKLVLDVVLVPTTVLSMADAGSGGKVRVSSIEGTVFHKHAYKSFYEPSRVILDKKFLTTYPKRRIMSDLAETIKHAAYQSPALAEYLLSNSFCPFDDINSLLKAILWTQDLKRVSLEGDPNEDDGGQRILRAAHNLSDRLEEESHFSLSHGDAVLRAMVREEKDPTKRDFLMKIYRKLGIPEDGVLS